MDKKNQDEMQQEKQQSENNGLSHEAEKYEPERLRKIFVSKLPLTTTEESLKAYFEQWGKVLKAYVIVDGNTKKSRGYGFVTFSSSLVIDAVLANRPHKFDGHNVDVKRAMTKELMGLPNAKEDTDRLFVGGLSPEVTEKELTMYFAQFGEVKDVRVIRNKENKLSRGFGFVSYMNLDTIDKVLLSGEHVILGKTLTVNKATARPNFMHQHEVTPPDVIYCACGGLLQWGGPNFGRGLPPGMPQCTCGGGVAKQANIGAGWYVSGDRTFKMQRHNNIMSPRVPKFNNIPPFPPALRGYVNHCQIFEMQPAPFPNMQVFKDEHFDMISQQPPPPYQALPPQAYQQQITDYQQLNKNAYKPPSPPKSVEEFIKYKNSANYDYDYECELFLQAFPSGATKAQQDAFFNQGIGRPPYGCGNYSM